MPESSEQLQIVITARDEASKVLQGLSGSLKKAETDTEGLTKKTTDQTSSFGAMTKGVFLGVGAYDLFRKGLSMATDFLKSSIAESESAQKQNAQTNAILKTMNTSLQEQAGLFDKVGKAAVQMGFDDEDASEALARLYQRTNDMKFAQEALLAAQDLARYKGISLTDATRNLSLAFGGSGRALKEMGFNVEDNTTQLDVLRVVQDKTRGSAAAFSETIAGKKASLVQNFDNLKQAIGDAILAGIAPYIKSVSDAVTRTADAGKVTAAWGEIVYRIAAGIQTLGGIFSVAAKSAGVLVASADSLFKHISSTVGGSKEAAQLADDALQNMTEDAAKSAQGVADGFKKMLGEGWNPASVALTDLTAKQDNYTAGVNQSIRTNNDATQSLKEYEKAMESGKNKISDFSTNLTRAYRDAWTKAKADTADAVANLTTELADLNTAHANTLTELGKFLTINIGTTQAGAAGSIAEILVQKQEESAELGRQIDAATTEDQKAELWKRKTAVDMFLTKHTQDLIDYEAEIKEIRDNGLLDEINKIEYQAAKKIQAYQEEYDAKVAQENDQYAADVDRANRTHSDRLARIQDQMDEVKKTYKRKFDDLEKDLRRSKLIELFDDLENIGKKLMKKRKKTEFEINLADFISSITGGGRQFGGSVSSDRAYVVGERRAEVFQPAVAGTIQPQVAGATTINFNGITVRSDGDVDTIVDRVQRVLGRRSELATRGVF